MTETKKGEIFKGAATALITPMNSDGSIDYTSLKRIIEFQISSGVGALVFLGTTGEAATLCQTEKMEVVDFAVREVNKRLPIIIGTGSNCTDSTVEFSKYAAGAGADALLVVTPYYNKATKSGLVKHYTAVADAVNTPIIVYNVPQRTGVNVTLDVYREIADHDNICAIKEASGNLSQICDIVIEFGDKLKIYSGSDDLTLPILSLGGMGVISVISNIIPSDTQKMCMEYLSGNGEASLQIHNKMLPLCRAIFSEVNPIPIKKACEIMGLSGGTVRLPLTEISDKNEMLLYQKMHEYGLI